MASSPNHRLIIGCGYLGRRVAERWLAANDHVSALTRSPENAAKLSDLGITPYLGDVLQPESLAEIPAVDTILWAVGWDRTSGVSQHDVYVQGLQNALRQSAGKYTRWIYISSTSVYGQTDGEWVDESTRCEPSQPNGQVCLTAENLIRAADGSSAGNTAQHVILRLSGSYGPDRLLSRLASLRAGEPLAGNPQAWLNLIHVDDAAEVVVRAARAEDPQPLFLISDNEPLIRRDYYSLLASLIGAQPPRFSEDLAAQSPPAPVTTGGRTLGLNKRCSNTLVRKTLAWNPQYPTCREGLPPALGPLK